MKNKYLITIFSSILSVLCFSQTQYKGLPVIKANSPTANFRIGNEFIKGQWNISPKIAADSLSVISFKSIDTFCFYTDSDSIAFVLQGNEPKSFYVQLSDSIYALTIVKKYAPHYSILEHDKKNRNKKYKFWYENNTNNEYLKRLRTNYPIDSIIKEANTDADRVFLINNWVHSLWQHNGSNKPEKKDALSILSEVKQGKTFRCVEYATVSAACLNAIGLKTRVVSLKTQDVETKEYGAGHVVLEVFLNDCNTWAFLDAQWGLMPLLNNKPLSTLAFQNAIATKAEQLTIKSLYNAPKSMYIQWIYPYLYYIEVPFDNTEGFDIKKKTIENKHSLMLVPLKAKNPSIFQINFKIDDCLYTNSALDLYQKPDDSK